MKDDRRTTFHIGIDEVGRGPLAGPVVVCAVAIPARCKPSSIIKKFASRSSMQLRDSKKLTAPQRALWATAIKSDSRIFYSLASMSPRVVDRINVTQAANHAATRAVAKLITQLPAPAKIEVFLDGGIFLLETRKMKHEKRGRFLSTCVYTDAEKKFCFPVATIIKGDEKIPAISLASILAKEYRDALMHRVHKKYPFYGFDTHVGYGTKKHIAAIHAHGRTPHHRESFLKKII
ncbi:MAG: Ribonuclease HII [Candidatus Wolfebacteria bacterium GW2011_GWC2_39_22]|uniref:Ribonuclease n=2 Tax=Candidatus Wolfeibacteriota TaxID=1752735 RepID=A0A0G1H873_9BACT|nr:MAG: Ribonuclease HII [Candidatus Wolfebacteria bacterium GW2011_GWC2_39_22]KKT43020.1 MAG: Ribonuclease HII [Candidatus Wolfebacteria bacterium GW2011_GWE2_44_13]